MEVGSYVCKLKGRKISAGKAKHCSSNTAVFPRSRCWQKDGIKLLAGIFYLDGQLHLGAVIALLAHAQRAGRIFQTGLSIHLQFANQRAPGNT
jgi:hypothetical protein